MRKLSRLPAGVPLVIGCLIGAGILEGFSLLRIRIGPIGPDVDWVPVVALLASSLALAVSLALMRRSRRG